MRVQVQVLVVRASFSVLNVCTICFSLSRNVAHAKRRIAENISMQKTCTHVGPWYIFYVDFLWLHCLTEEHVLVCKHKTEFPLRIHCK